MIADIDSLDPQQLRQAVRELQEVVQRQARESAHKQAIIDKLTHENAVLKRLKFAAQSERNNAACWRKRSTPICRPCPRKLSASHRRTSPLRSPPAQSASRCPRNCRGARFAMSRRAPSAAAAAR